MIAAIKMRPVSRSSVAGWGWWLTALIVTIWAAGLIVGFETSLLVLTILGLSTAILGLRWPWVGLLGVSMLCTLDVLVRVYLTTEDSLLRWNSFNYLLLGVMVLFCPVLLRLNDVHSRLLQLFLLVLVLQLTISPDFERGVLDLLNIVTVFGLLLYFHRAREHREVWYWLGVVNGVLACSGGLVFYLQKESLPYVNPNAWAYFPITALFSICLAFPFAEQHRRGQLLLSSLAVLNVVWVFLSGSRGGLLTASFCLIFLTVQVKKLSRRVVYFAAAGALGIVIAGLFSNLQEHTIYRIDKLINAEDTLSVRTSGRSDLSLVGWYIFLDHPLGVGTGGFAPVWARVTGRENLSGFKKGIETDAHSAWIKTLVENGLPGVLLFAAYVFSFAVVGWRKRKKGVFVSGLLVTVTLSVACLSTEFAGKGLWFLAAGITALLHSGRIVNRQSRVLRRRTIARGTSRKALQ